MTRSQSREVAFILLFEKTFTDDPFDELVERLSEGSQMEIDAFARSLAAGSIAHQNEIDDLLSSCSQNWKLGRISRVSLSAMRIAGYEMLYVDNIPVSVSINEAIELTKKYASPEDASYVNGVLGALAKKFQKPDAEAEKPQADSAAPKTEDAE